MVKVDRDDEGAGRAAGALPAAGLGDGAAGRPLPRSSSAAAATSSRQFPEIGLPNAAGQLQRLEEPGRPDIRQSNRGPGTGLRVAIPVLNITKTRLNDPHLVPRHQRPARRLPHLGLRLLPRRLRQRPRPAPLRPLRARSATGARRRPSDPTIPKDEPGHPLKHEFTRAIPTSQCMICHMHQPNMFVNTFLGYTMWDYESDAPLDVAEAGAEPQPRRAAPRSSTATPRTRRSRGLWGDLDFLSKVWTDVNPKAEGHAVRRLPRPRLELPRGLQARPQGQPARRGRARSCPTTRPTSSSKAVHMSSIHVDVGMHCVDCHFAQDGTATASSTARSRTRSRSTARTATARPRPYPTLRTSNPAAPPRRHGPHAAAHARRPAALRVARRQALSALDGRPEARVGDVAGEGHRRPGQPRLQREGGARED